MERRLSTGLLRGTVWEFDFETGASPKPALVVSNNSRNASAWPMVHVVRITSAPKLSRDTIVEIPPGESVSGRVICDDLEQILKTQLGRRMGALSPRTMRAVDSALRTVLAL